MSILHQRVTIIRKLQGLSAYSIEKGSGIGIASLKNWKTSMPSGDKILRVANFLDVSTDYLLGNTDNPHSHKNNPQDLVAAARDFSALVQEAKAATDKLAGLLEAHNLDPAPTDFTPQASSGLEAAEHPQKGK